MKKKQQKEEVLEEVSFHAIKLKSDVFKEGVVWKAEMLLSIGKQSSQWCVCMGPNLKKLFSEAKKMTQEEIEADSK